MEDVAAAKSLDMLTYMYNYGLEGNVVDHTWYEIFRLRKGIPEEGEEQLFGKPHLEAIILLSDIVYWYRPKVEKDHNGKISLAKKFSADILQRSYSQIESALGLTDREAKSAMLTLEFYGVARRVFRTITVNGLKLSNVMYIAFDPIKLKDLMLSALEKRSVEEEEGKNGKEELKKIQTYDVQTSHPPRSNVTPPTFKRHTYTETSSETSSEKNNNRPPAVAAQAVVVFPFLDDLLKAISGLPISNADARDIAADYKHLPRKEALSIIEAYVSYVRNSKRPIDSYAATLRTAFLKKWTAKEDRSKKLKEQFDREQKVCDSNREICDIVKAKTRQIQGLTLRPGEKYLEIQLSCWPEAQKIYFLDKSFREQLDSVLRKVHSSLNALLNPYYSYLLF